LKVLLVDDSRSARQLTAAYLSEFGHPAVEAEDGPQAIERFQVDQPDLVLLDVEMPGMDGYAVARAMRSLEQGQNDWVPIIFLSGRASDADIERGIEVGGDDYIVKPVSPTVLRAKLRAMERITDMRRRLMTVSSELQTVNESLRKLSAVDALTGVANRRGFDERLEETWAAAGESMKPVTLILGDVDYFKRYNDRYGHPAGDDCLQRVAQAMTKAVRGNDFVARYGGEEFAVILRGVDASISVMVAERILAQIRALALPHQGSSVSAHVTISLGVVIGIPSPRHSVAGLIRLADEALYQAKSEGRNRACLKLLGSGRQEAA